MCVQGACIAGGCILAWGSDYSVMSEGKHTIGLNETQLVGIIKASNLCGKLSRNIYIHVLLLCPSKGGHIVFVCVPARREASAAHLVRSFKEKFI